jgi:hypothetical protein
MMYLVLPLWVELPLSFVIAALLTWALMKLEK